MKTKLTKYAYDINTKTATVEIQNKYGTFTGTAKLNPEDESVESHYLGGQIAESRARIKSIRKQAASAVHDATILTQYQNSMKDTRNFNEHDYYYKALSHRIKMYLDKAESLRQQATAIESTLDKYIKTQQDRINNLRGNCE